MGASAVDDKSSDTLVVVSGEGFWTGSSTLPHLHHIRASRTEVAPMTWSIYSLIGAVILLGVADFLAFHDLFEPHTVRDWLMLAASGLVAVSLAGRSVRRIQPFSRGR
jgi:drug/metabolite transporter (DMT)-like permease